MTPLQTAFSHQAKACASLGSPFMARLCTLAATRPLPAGPVADRLLGWQADDLGPSGDSVALRFCGALHALALRGAGLAAAYPPHHVEDDGLWQAICTAVTDHAPAILEMLDSAPQTNEVRRSSALIAAGHWLRARYDLPFTTFELGASAGLNLNWDRYAIELPQGRLGAADPALTLRPDWTGPLPAGPAPRVAKRAGVDLNPLDPTDPDQALRLRAYLWADQPERQALTQAAIAAMTPGMVARGDAIDWLADRLAPVPGHLRLIYHTIAWQYFPAPVQTRGTDLIEAAGAEATPDSPLAWVRMEADGAGDGAGLTLRLWPDEVEITLARVDFHGRWVRWLA